MSGTPPIDSLVTLINQKGLTIGNNVLAAGGTPTTASQVLYVDSNGNLAQGTIPFALPISQGTVTSPMFTLTGSATADVLTQTLVAGASVTTATKAGFVRVNVTDAGGVMTNGNYYLELFTIT